MSNINPNQFKKNSLAYLVANGEVEKLKNRVWASHELSSKHKCQESRFEYSLLHIAAFNGHTQTLLTLIDKGAHINPLRDGLTPTPLHAASSKGHTETVRALLSRGAIIDRLDGSGRTALDCAARAGHLETVKVLIEQSAQEQSVKVTESPYQLAAINHHLGIVEYLRNIETLRQLVDEITQAFPLLQQAKWTEFGARTLKSNVFKLLLKRLDEVLLCFDDSLAASRLSFAQKCAKVILEQKAVTKPDLLDDIISSEKRALEHFAPSMANSRQSSPQLSSGSTQPEVKAEPTSKKFFPLLNSLINHERHYGFGQNQKCHGEIAMGPLARQQFDLDMDTTVPGGEHPQVSSSLSSSQEASHEDFVVDEQNLTQSEENLELKLHESVEVLLNQDKPRVDEGSEQETSPEVAQVPEVVKRSHEAIGGHAENLRPFKQSKEKQEQGDDSQQTVQPLQSLKRERMGTQQEHKSRVKKPKLEGIQSTLKRERVYGANDPKNHAPRKKVKKNAFTFELDIEGLSRAFNDSLTFSRPKKSKRR